jgi:hypothetical protein
MIRVDLLVNVRIVDAWMDMFRAAQGGLEWRALREGKAGCCRWRIGVGGALAGGGGL